MACAQTYWILGGLYTSVRQKVRWVSQPGCGFGMFHCLRSVPPEIIYGSQCEDLWPWNSTVRNNSQALSHCKVPIVILVFIEIPLWVCRNPSSIRYALIMVKNDCIMVATAVESSTGCCLTKAYDVTTQSYGETHTQIKVSEMVCGFQILCVNSKEPFEILESIRRKICILWGVKIFTSYAIWELWYLKS